MVRVEIVSLDIRSDHALLGENTIGLEKKREYHAEPHGLAYRSKENKKKARVALYGISNPLRIFHRFVWPSR